MTAQNTATPAPGSSALPAPANIALTIQLLEWIERQPRSYQDTLEAWQTHCPRFTIWEDANSLGLVRNVRCRDAAGGLRVVLTDAGRALLAEHRN